MEKKEDVIAIDDVEYQPSCAARSKNRILNEKAITTPHNRNVPMTAVLYGDLTGDSMQAAFIQISDFESASFTVIVDDEEKYLVPTNKCMALLYTTASVVEERAKSPSSGNDEEFIMSSTGIWNIMSKACNGKVMPRSCIITRILVGLVIHVYSWLFILILCTPQKVYGQSQNVSLPLLSGTDESTLWKQQPFSQESLIALDDYNRRYFPVRGSIGRPEGSFASTPVPNCEKFKDYTGCIALPSTHVSNPPLWAGKLYFTPPVCKHYNGSCNLGIPMSITKSMLSEPLLVDDKNIPFVTHDPIDLPGQSATTRSIAVGDIDGDGLADVVIGNDGGPNYLLLNQPDGTFRYPTLLPGGRLHTHAVAIADIDNDGHFDIIIGNMNQRNQMILNEKNGIFSVKVLPGEAMSTSCVAVADVNGDGMVDIILGTDKANKILINKGNRQFLDPIDLSPGSKGEITKSVAVADINNDGLIDIVLGNWFSANQILMNTGGGFNEPVAIPGGNSLSHSVAVADINGDGFIDIVVGNVGSPNQLLVNKHGKFAEIINLPGGSKNTESIAAADLNGDGLVDLVAGNNFQRNQILLNIGNNNFHAVTIAGGILLTKSVATGDLDNDGLIDIVIGNEGGQSNQIHVSHVIKNYYGSAIDLELYGMHNTYCNAIADFDGDGNLDIVFGNYNHANQVLFNDGNGNITRSNVLKSTQNAHSVAVADVNNDGLIDIIFGNFGDERDVVVN
jgi:FG-GAP repeat.